MPEPQTPQQKNIEKPKNHIARRDKLKISPVPWAILILIAFAIFFVFGYGKMNAWLNNRQEISDLTKELTRYEEEIVTLRDNVDVLRLQFEELAGPQLEKERKIFPESLDTKKIVKILELFSIQLLNTAERGYEPVFSLNSLTLSNPTTAEDLANAQKLPVSMSFVTDERNLKTFIDYLQNNEMPQRMVDANNRGLLDSLDYPILESETLPVMLIGTLTKSPTGEDGEVLSVSISSDFYFQLSNDDNSTSPR